MVWAQKNQSGVVVLIVTFHWGRGAVIPETGRKFESQPLGRGFKARLGDRLETPTDEWWKELQRNEIERT
jgi:hypothetical protein